MHEAPVVRGRKNGGGDGDDVHRASIVTSLSGNWRRFLARCAEVVRSTRPWRSR
jgi:hypothetical protein